MCVRMDEPHSEDSIMKQCDKTKEQIRRQRQRNLVAKNNKHKGGYHTPAKYQRTEKYKEQTLWNYLY